MKKLFLFFLLASAQLIAPAQGNKFRDTTTFLNSVNIASATKSFYYKKGASPGYILTATDTFGKAAWQSFTAVDSCKSLIAFTAKGNPSTMGTITDEMSAVNLDYVQSTGGGYNTSTDKFIAPETGFYQFGYSVAIQSDFQSSNGAEAYLYDGNKIYSQIASREGRTGTYPINIANTAVIHLNAGDSLGLYVRADGTVQQWWSDSTTNYWYGYKLYNSSCGEGGGGSSVVIGTPTHIPFFNASGEITSDANFYRDSANNGYTNIAATDGSDYSSVQIGSNRINIDALSAAEGDYAFVIASCSTEFSGYKAYFAAGVNGNSITVGTDSTTLSFVAANSSNDSMLLINEYGSLRKAPIPSGGGGGLETDHVTISSSQILNGYTTPVTVVAAPGSGYMINVHKVIVHYVYGSVPYSGGVMPPNAAPKLVYSSGSGTVVGISSTADVTNDVWLNMPTFDGNTNSSYENSSIDFVVQDAPMTDGDGHYEIYITYQIIEL